ncbi:MAG TPA: Smr/MutS family protein, partial [Dermatophilaceae bacterium]|nr:Smr/MutS family protein [Dermatophilaceae bacterium]
MNFRLLGTYVLPRLNPPRQGSPAFGRTRLANNHRSPEQSTGGDAPVCHRQCLHDIYNHGGDIDRALRAIIDEAVKKKAPLVEIIPGKGSGALKKRVLRFLDQKEIKALYHRVEKDPWCARRARGRP